MRAAVEDRLVTVELSGQFVERIAPPPFSFPNAASERERIQGDPGGRSSAVRALPDRHPGGSESIRAPQEGALKGFQPNTGPRVASGSGGGGGHLGWGRIEGTRIGLRKTAGAGVLVLQ